MSDISQPAGWWLATDGKWYPPESMPPAPPKKGHSSVMGDSRSSLATLVIVVIGACSAVVVVGGLLAAIVVPANLSNTQDSGLMGNDVALGIAMAVGSIFYGALLAGVALVIDYLDRIARDVHRIAT